MREGLVSNASTPSYRSCFLGRAMCDAPAPEGASPPDILRAPDGKARPSWAMTSPLMQEYYDTEWGVPVRDEQGVFERICLEAFQAGLSWRTVLEKREAFREVFFDFVPERVAEMTEDDIAQRMQDTRIIRNRKKIEATVHNARRTLALRSDGGLHTLVWSFQPDRTPVPRTLDEIPTQSEASVALSKALKKRGFKFVGPTTMYALMEAIGMIDTHLVGSHRRGVSGLWTADGRRIAALNDDASPT